MGREGGARYLLYCESLQAIPSSSASSLRQLRREFDRKYGKSQIVEFFLLLGPWDFIFGSHASQNLLSPTGNKCNAKLCECNVVAGVTRRPTKRSVMYCLEAQFAAEMKYLSRSDLIRKGIFRNHPQRYRQSRVYWHFSKSCMKRPRSENNEYARAASTFFPSSSGRVHSHVDAEIGRSLGTRKLHGKRNLKTKVGGGGREEKLSSFPS